MNELDSKVVLACIQRQTSRDTTQVTISDKSQGFLRCISFFFVHHGLIWCGYIYAILSLLTPTGPCDKSWFVRYLLAKYLPAPRSTS